LLCYDKAVSILEKHFAEDEDEDENIAPSATNGGFTFGATPLAPSAPAFVF
jgi:hypothetical protein